MAHRVHREIKLGYPHRLENSCRNQETTIDREDYTTMNDYRPDDHTVNAQKLLTTWMIAILAFIVLLSAD